MPTTKLLDTLLKIERSVGRADNATMRNMIMDAENQVLGIQQDVLRVLEELRQARAEQETKLAEESWHAVAQAIARHAAEKRELARTAIPLVVTEMEKRVS